MTPLDEARLIALDALARTDLAVPVALMGTHLGAVLMLESLVTMGLAARRDDAAGRTYSITATGQGRLATGRVLAS